MSIPTSIPTLFCTTVAKRAAVSAGRVLNGWTGGEAVPAGQNNTLQGQAAEWVRYVRDRWGYGLGEHRVSLQSLTWHKFEQGGSTVNYSVDPPERLNAYGGDVTVTRTSGTDPATGIVASFPTEGGYLAGVEVTSVGSGADAQVTVTVTDYGGTVRARYADTTIPAASGTTSLTAVDVTPATCEKGYVTIHIAASADSSSETFEVSDIRLFWGDAP